MKDNPNQNHLLKLVRKYVSGRATEAEAELLEAFYQYYNRDDFDKHLKEEELLLLEDEMIAATWSKIDVAAKPVVRRRLPQRLIASLSLRTPVASYSFRRIGTVAVLFIFLFLGGLFYFHDGSRLKSVEANKLSNVVHGINGATLTLSNGKKIILNNSANGELAVETGVSITKTKQGVVVYKIKSAPRTNDNAMNVLATAKGQQYEIQLPDGTNVWLNAASSLTYPASFTGAAERKVELNGEGYFEVAKDQAHPFIVSASQQRVEVLGTHFNISSYLNDPETRTTLLEGLVKINGAFLNPGQQATQVNGNITIQNSNTEAAVAWKNGLFIFDKEPLESIMRKVARWYNVKIIYAEDADKSYLYGGSVSRYEKIEKLLQKLQAVGGMHYKLTGQTLYIER